MLCQSLKKKGTTKKAMQKQQQQAQQPSWLGLTKQPHRIDFGMGKRPAYMCNRLDAYQEHVMTEVMPNIESNEETKKNIRASLRSHVMRAFQYIESEKGWRAWNDCLESQEILNQAAIIAEVDVCGFVGAGEHLPPGIFQWLVEVFPEDFDNAARAKAICKQIHETLDDMDGQ